MCVIQYVYIYVYTRTSEHQSPHPITYPGNKITTSPNPHAEYILVQLALVYTQGN